MRWSQDGEGYIHYASYHSGFGTQAYLLRDVDPEARRSMDGRRMTGPEPRMASNDDAMEAAAQCGSRNAECRMNHTRMFQHQKNSGASSIDGAQRHRAVTDGAAQATESGAHHVAERSKQLGPNHD